ncbi:hypothetical protein KR222_003851, partial [Zaprionus bogoriensis]
SADFRTANMARFNGKILLSVIGIAALLGATQGANILGVFTSISPSHLIVQMSMIKVLAEAGHNVTVVTALKPAVSHKDINVIQVSFSEEDRQKMSSSIGSMVSNDNSNMLLSVFRSFGQMQFMFQKMEDVLMDQRVKDLYENKDNHFDLVMIGYFMNNYQIGLAHKLKAPVVLAVSLPPIELINPVFGNPDSESHVPALNIAVENGRPMSFVLRVKNFISAQFMKLFFWVVENSNAKAYKRIFGDDPTMPKYSDLHKNLSLGFFSSHALSEGPIRPNVPAIIEVGGIQVKDKADPLPTPIADFLGNATDDAILLCLGSNVQGKHLKADTVQKMFNVLSKLKQRVIWKWEDLDKTPGKSDNILYLKWLPQDDILAHPKIKLFITHAGKGGITESQYHGKPMLALPVFGDQPSNAEKMVKDGFGLSLGLLTLEEKPFHDSITEIWTNPQYAQKVKTFSTLYRDRPLSARQSILYWSEYVIRHHGAAHLQSPLLHMNFIEASNLDVYALLLGIILVLLFIGKFVLTFVYSKLKGKPKNTKKTKTN